MLIQKLLYRNVRVCGSYYLIESDNPCSFEKFNQPEIGVRVPLMNSKVWGETISKRAFQHNSDYLITRFGIQ